MPKDIHYDIRRNKRNKRLQLTIYPNSRIVVTAPIHVTDTLISHYVARHIPWIQHQLEELSCYSDCIFLPEGRHDYLKYKERARIMIHAILEKNRHEYGVSYGRVSIKNLRRNWGSCSSKKNLNFNYKLIHIPKTLAEYVIVHELCHLLEFNHSKRFWSLVAKTIPDYKNRRKALAKYFL